MKTYDAVLIVKHRISCVCTDEDLSEGFAFEDLVRDLITSEGLMGIVDDEHVIVSIEQEVQK